MSTEINCRNCSHSEDRHIAVEGIDGRKLGFVTCLTGFCGCGLPRGLADRIKRGRRQVADYRVAKNSTGARKLRGESAT